MESSREGQGSQMGQKAGADIEASKQKKIWYCGISLLAMVKW